MSVVYRLRFRPEFGLTGCLWTDNDAARALFGDYYLEPERLLLSSQTILRIEQLCMWYQTALNWDYPPDPGPWRQAECDRFNAAILDLFHDLTAELGADFEVINAQRPMSEDPDLDSYLKDPKGFRRPHSQRAHTTGLS